jgi:O-antigen/teichoic acid export membrane protein
LIAASNFLVALLLARRVSAPEYGAFALAFEIYLLLIVFYTSFVLEPMSVFGSSTYRDRRREYLGTLLRLTFGIALLTVVLLAAASYLAHAVWGNHDLAKALLGVAFAGPVILLFWMARRAFYLEFAPASSVAGAALYSVVLMIALLVCYRQHWLSSFTVFALMGTAAAVAGPVLLQRLRPVLGRTPHSPRIGEVLVKHWEYGRWALGSSAAAWIIGAALYFALTTFHGLSRTGDLKALLNLASPVSQGFTAISLLALPYASRLMHGDNVLAVRRVAQKLTALYMTGTAAYFLVLLFARRWLLGGLYAGKYSAVAELVPVIALGLILRIGATAQAIPLRATHSPSRVCLAYAIAAAATVLIGVPLIRLFGLPGAAWTSVVSGGTALLATGWLLRRTLAQTELKAPQWYSLRP